MTLRLRDLIGRVAVAFDEHAYGADTGFLGALTKAVALKGSDRLLVPIGGHDVSPLLG